MSDQIKRDLAKKDVMFDLCRNWLKNRDGSFNLFSLMINGAGSSPDLRNMGGFEFSMRFVKGCYEVFDND